MGSKKENYLSLLYQAASQEMGLTPDRLKEKIKQGAERRKVQEPPRRVRPRVRDHEDDIYAELFGD